MLSGHKTKRRLRDPERTRERLLQARLFGRYTDQASRGAGIDTIPRRHQRSPRERLYHALRRARKPWDTPSSMRSLQSLSASGWLRPLLSDGQPIDDFDRHCPADTRSAARHSSRLSAAQFSNGDVSAGRAIHRKRLEEAISCLAGRSRHAFAPERAGPKHRSP